MAEKGLTIHKARWQDIDAIVDIYNKIHTSEENGQVTIGWDRTIYPTRQTASDALNRDDLFVMTEEGQIVGSAIINQRQVPEYYQADWQYQDVDDRQVMVLHTLTIDPDEAGRGLGRQLPPFMKTTPKNTHVTIYAWTPMRKM